MIKLTNRALLVFVLSMVCCQPASPCTVFAVSQDGTVLFANNEDWKDPYSRIWFLPAEDGKHGRMYLGFDRFGVTIPQGGLNDQGLAFDILAGPSYRVQGDPAKERYGGNLIVKAMEECTTVKQVVAMFGRYNLEGTWQGQYFFADRTGDAVIIEGDKVHRKKGRFLVATNFYLSQSKSEGHQCRRYDTATEMLEKRGPVTTNLCRRVLEAVKQEGATPTVYSNVFDLRKGIVNLYHLHDFASTVSLKLETELRKKPHTIDIASLFRAKPPLSGTKSPVKEPVSRLLARVMDEQNVSEAIKRFRLLEGPERLRYDCSERVLNLFGIDLVYMGRIADGIEVLELVVEKHPQSANAFDSLAWAYMKNGQNQQAIVNYEKSLEMNPENANAATRLQELRDR